MSRRKSKNPSSAAPAVMTEAMKALAPSAQSAVKALEEAGTKANPEFADGIKGLPQMVPSLTALFTKMASHSGATPPLPNAAGSDYHRRQQRIEGMCKLASGHLYSVQYNQCCCGWKPTDTPVDREFLAHVMTLIVDAGL